jgi:hypothetical protein
MSLYLKAALKIGGAATAVGGFLGLTMAASNTQSVAEAYYGKARTDAMFGDSLSSVPYTVAGGILGGIGVGEWVCLVVGC